MKILNTLLLIFIICFSTSGYGYAETLNSACGTTTSIYQDANETFVKADGAQIFCRVFGKGDPIIVIHGGPGLSQDYLLPQMARLAKDHLVIFYDQRGCGRSTGEINADTMQIKIFLNDLEAIKKSFGFKKVTILGHSWGGLLAMQYANGYPESIHKLILLNSVPASSEEHAQFGQEWIKRMAPYQDELKAIKETPQFVNGDPATVEKYNRIVFRQYCCNPKNADFLNLCMSQKAAVDGAKVLALFKQNFFSKTYNFYYQLKQINIPTLIIHGDCDPVPPSSAQNIHESIKGSKYILIKDCGHFPYVEAPEELFNYLNDFFRQDAK